MSEKLTNREGAMSIAALEQEFAQDYRNELDLADSLVRQDLPLDGAPLVIEDLAEYVSHLRDRGISRTVAILTIHRFCGEGNVVIKYHS